MSRRFRFPAFVLLPLLSLAVVAVAATDVANAQSGELNWPSKQLIHPRDITLSYPCGGGATCDLAGFMGSI